MHPCDSRRESTSCTTLLTGREGTVVFSDFSVSTLTLGSVIVILGGLTPAETGG